MEEFALTPPTKKKRERPGVACPYEIIESPLASTAFKKRLPQRRVSGDRPYQEALSKLASAKRINGKDPILAYDVSGEGDDYRLRARLVTQGIRRAAKNMGFVVRFTYDSTGRVLVTILEAPE